MAGPTIKLTRAMDIYLSAADIAEVFCELDDDAQAQFFVHVARIMGAWPEPGAATMQPYFIGKHLATCECGTEGARQFIRDVAEAMKP